MSTYLLLRNNKESGPYTIEELKQLSLKSYDLVWVEGKSAAWRYPGEIPEFSSFAPPVPEQPFDRFYKKADPAAEEIKILKSGSTVAENTMPGMAVAHGEPLLNPDAGRREPTATEPAGAGREAVYINLPASEKETAGFHTGIPLRQPIDLDWEEPQRGADRFPVIRPKKEKRSGLLAMSIILFFSAGMATGFFISNRRNIYPANGNSSRQVVVPVSDPTLPPAPPEHSGSLSAAPENSQPSPVAQESKPPAIPRSRKRAANPASGKKDSLHMAVNSPVLSSQAADSLQKKEAAENSMHALAAKIRAHPEEYLLVTTGNYKVGMLGGISEVPVSVTNRSGVSMDLVVVAVDYIQHNKKLFKTESLSFHDLAPGATATVEAPKSSRGVKVTHRLTVANAQQIGLSYSSF
jgi:hypothetical protein